MNLFNTDVFIINIIIIDYFIFLLNYYHFYSLLYYHKKHFLFFQVKFLHLIVNLKEIYVVIDDSLLLIIE